MALPQNTNDPEVGQLGRRNSLGTMDSNKQLSTVSLELSQKGSSSSSSSDDWTLEKAVPALPPKHGNTQIRWLHHTFFTVYRKMFGVIFVFNMTALVIFMAKNHGSPTMSNVKNATSANILACILMRQENAINLVYELFTCAPHSTPLWIRRKLAKVYHYGGVHSGCGVAAVFWFILYTILATIDFVKHPRAGLPVANVITCYLCVTMFFFILVGAYPRIRIRFHDYFEAVHRFAGWASLVILWAQTFIVAVHTYKTTDVSLAHAILTAPSFWFLALSTCCTFLSWSRLRHRAVRAEVLSPHATRLHFEYRNMPPFYGLKISDRPLLEWHAFATIPEPDGKGFSVVVSNAGDWTRKTIQEPPKKLWTRGYPLHGLLYTSRLFRQIVLVATGSGIGPCLSLMHSNKTPRRIFWSTRDPVQTYGQGVVDTVRNADPNAVIWNTSGRKYPDMVMETWKLIVECNAEAVFIISNPKVTKKVVYGMESRGMAAYGAIFDS